VVIARPPGRFTTDLAAIVQRQAHELAGGIKRE